MERLSPSKSQKAGSCSNIVAAPVPAAAPAATGSGETVKAVLAGNIFKVHVAPGSGR